MNIYIGINKVYICIPIEILLKLLVTFLWNTRRVENVNKCLCSVNRSLKESETLNSQPRHSYEKVSYAPFSYLYKILFNRDPNYILCRPINLITYHVKISFLALLNSELLMSLQITKLSYFASLHSYAGRKAFILKLTWHELACFVSWWRSIIPL